MWISFWRSKTAPSIVFRTMRAAIRIGMTSVPAPAMEVEPMEL